MKKLLSELTAENIAPFVGVILCAIFYLGIVSPIIVHGLPNSQHQEASHKSEGADKGQNVSEPQAGGDAITTYTLWLAVFTAVLAVSTIGLWVSTQNTFAHGVRVSERELRAYINVFESRIDSIEAGKSPVAKVRIQNFGQTPAYNLSQGAIMGYQKYPLEAPPPSLRPQESDPAQPIPPGGYVHIQPTLKEPLTASQIKALTEGEFALFVVGEVSYTDCFGNRRFTKYCVFSGGKVNDGRAVPLGATASYITGNECD